MTELTLNFSFLIGGSNGKTNFQHKFIINDREVPKLQKAFVDNLSAKIELLETQLTKIM